MAVSDLQSPLFYRKISFDQDKFKQSAESARERLKKLEAQTEVEDVEEIEETEAENQSAEEELQRETQQQRMTIVSQRMTVQRTMPPAAQTETQPPSVPQPPPNYQQFSGSGLSVNYTPIDMLAWSHFQVSAAFTSP